jgi:hypothetical protein
MALIFRGAGIMSPPPPSEATVLIDAVAFSVPGNNLVTSDGFSASTHGFSLNIGSGSNGTSNLCLLTACMFVGAAAGTSTFNTGGLFWDSTGTNQQMTAVPGASLGNGNAGDIFWFYLMNPTLGLHTLACSWAVANQVLIGAASFVHVDQTGGATSFPTVVLHSGTGTSANASITTSPTTRKLISAFTSAGNFNVGGNSGTDIGHDDSGTVSSGAACWDLGTASSLSYTATSGVWAAVAFAIKGN